MVYFIRQDAAVKIGYTKQIKYRLSELQVSNPNELTVLLLIKGGIKLEQELHKRFVDDKIRGEWYYLSDEVRDFIASQYDNDLRYDEGLSDDIDPSVQTAFIRNAHGLNLREMGDKLNISPQSVRETENRELHGTISINKMREFGEALGYDLVYKFIKKPTT